MKKRFSISLSALSVFPHSALRAVEMARAYDFDGIELFLHQYALPQILACYKRAQDLRIKTTLHQFWSCHENPSLMNHMLRLLGYTLPHGYTLQDALPEHTLAPVIIYADRYHEALELRHTCWWQTISLFPGGEYSLPYGDFVALVEQHKPGIVFDTQHILEYMLDRPGIEQLSTDPDVLMQQLETAWAKLGTYVREIHFNDCDPARGERGRNVFPGTGRMPLKEFSQMVRASGWHGSIVPEVSPVHLFPARRKLPLLRERMKEYWDR